MPTHLFQNDTIAAIATPPGLGAIGVIRLSGAKAPIIVEALWQGKTPLQQFKSHQMYFGTIKDPQGKEEIDQALAVWMKAPRSYTGEEVLELQVHGGPLILNKALQACLDLGARVAEPGEFTRRAFFNGKLDLLQAEAVGEMIHAQSDLALKNAKRQLEGRISTEVNTLREALIDLLARMEAAVDFPEEDIELIKPKESLVEINKLQSTLKSWLEKFNLGRLIHEGVKVAILGRPNVGKSSLLNALVGEDKAIVYDQPGTTRDVVEAHWNYGGLNFVLLDTAGIRHGEGAIEKEGIRRSQKAAASADFILWVLDASESFTPQDEAIVKELCTCTLVVANKKDVGIKLKHFPKNIKLPDTLKEPWNFISASTGAGVEDLKKALWQAADGEALSARAEAYLNNARHYQALAEALAGLDQAAQALDQNLPAECVAADLRQASQALGALIGEVSTEDVLDRVFERFCLGK